MALAGSARDWMLPPLLFPRAPPMCSTDMPLQGIARPRGRRSKDEIRRAKRPGAAAAAAAAEAAAAPAPAPTAADGVERLRQQAAKLRGPTSSASSFARRWQAAVQTLMEFKAERYRRERAELQEEIDDAQAKAAAFVRQARSGGDDALADEYTGKWEVAKEVNSRWQVLVAQGAALDRIVLTARRRADTINNASDFAWQRHELAEAIERLASDYASQGPLLGTLADLIDGFVTLPLVASQTMLNIISVSYTHLTLPTIPLV